MAFDAGDINKVIEGKYKDTSTSPTKTAENKSPNNALGKEAFLKLLVTQMQYQDPLNPQQDTDFISQLAQFSSLEQMQNLNETVSNSSSFSLVGRTATITETADNGTTKTITGVIDYVTRSGGKSYVSINDTKYSVDDISQVYDDIYAAKQYLPSVEAQKAVYDFADPKDITIKVDLGSKEYAASGVGVKVGKNTIDTKYLNYEDGKLTISKDAFSDYDAGKYDMSFVFDNYLYTTIDDKVSLEVKGIKSPAK